MLQTPSLFYIRLQQIKIACSFLIFLLVIVVNVRAQTCITDTYHMELPAPAGEKIRLSALETLPGGDQAVAGTIIQNGVSQGFLVRMRPTGSIIAAQRITINGLPTELSSMHALLNGKVALAGMLHDGTNRAFVSLWNADLTINWSKTIQLASSPQKLVMDLRDSSGMVLSVQTNGLIEFCEMKLDGSLVWSNELQPTGLTDLIGIHAGHPCLIYNCFRNALRTVEITDISASDGSIVSSHTLDDVSSETLGLQSTDFSNRVRMLGISRSSSGIYELERDLFYSGSSFDTRHRYNLPFTLDFSVTAALDHAGDVLGLCLPSAGKLIFIKQLANYYPLIEHSRSYDVPPGSSLSSVVRTTDGGFLFGLTTKDSGSLVLIKTDSSGIVSGCTTNDVQTNLTQFFNGKYFSSSINTGSFLATSESAISSLSPLIVLPQFSCHETFCPTPPVDDPCLTSYYKTLRSHSYQDPVYSYHLMRNNIHLVATSRYDRMLGMENQITGGLKIFSESGQFLKGVKIFQEEATAPVVIEKMTDSTVMIVTYSSPGGIGSYTLTLVSDQLQPIWSTTLKTDKNFNFTSGGSLSPCIHRDFEGNYYFIGARPGYVGELPAVLVYKLNPNGKGLWLKAYEITGATIFFSQVCAVSTESSVIMIIEGDNGGSVTVRLDRNSGNYLSAYRYNNTGTSSIYQRHASVYLDHILYVGGNHNGDFLMASFDTLGVPIRLRSIPHSSIMRATAFNGGFLYGAYQTYKESSNSFYNVLVKADTALNIQWYHEFDPVNYGYPYGMDVNDKGFIYQGGSAFSSPQANYLDSWLAKFTPEGELGTCTHLSDIPPTQDADPQPFSLSASPLQRSFEQIDIPISFVDDTDGLQIDKLYCNSSSTCNILSLGGPTSICKVNQDVSYQITTGTGCNLIARWQIDTAMVSIRQAGKSNAVLRFKKSGTTWLHAQLNAGCVTYFDSIKVTIHAAPDLIDLGKDTSLCPGNSFTLHAGEGFDHYSWQDGSADSSFFVSAPGNYFVQATNSCGEVFNDTILVTPHPAIPFTPIVDRTKCNSDTVHLTAETGFINYHWSPSYQMNGSDQREVVVSPLVDTVYYLSAEKLPGCFIRDTIQVHVFTSPPVHLGADTSFCEGSSLSLVAPPGFIKYQWNNSDTTQGITIHQAGSYHLLATTAEGCRSSDTLSVLNVWKNPTISLDKTNWLCQGSVRVLDAGSYEHYHWQDGSVSQTFTAHATGSYSVEVTDIHGCKGSDSTKIISLVPSPKDFLPADTVLCSYSKMELRALKSFSSYTWSNGMHSAGITVAKPAIYWLDVTESHGCKGRDSILIEPKDCMEGVYIPTAFTPNNDGRNDQFRALVFGLLKHFQMTIYNRWGTVVFTSHDPARGWDGKYAGLEQGNHLFIWTCTYQFEGGEQKTEKGTVMLLR
ncbi:MAG: gliding motility-associated C-terminal domain-containing protein [Flavisolibacter sp.]